MPKRALPKTTRLKPPLVIGLVGGIASGKSTVAAEFAKLGATVLDADAVGHEALEDAEVRRQLVAAFGSEILGDDGGVVRGRLAALTFGDAQAVKRLTGITHPWIRATMQRRISDARKRRELRAIILDVSLLLESGAYREMLDLLIFVEASEEQRKERARGRGWDEQELERREAHQMALAAKRKVADLIVQNDGDLKALRQQVSKIWKDRVEREER